MVRENQNEEELRETILKSEKMATIIGLIDIEKNVAFCPCIRIFFLVKNLSFFQFSLKSRIFFTFTSFSPQVRIRDKEASDFSDSLPVKMGEKKFAKGGSEVPFPELDL